MKRKNGPRHERHVKSLEQLENSYGIKYISGNNGSVMCIVDDLYHNWFVRVPKHVFDSVSRGGLTTIGEVKNYLREHPQP